MGMAGSDRRRAGAVVGPACPVRTGSDRLRGQLPEAGAPAELLGECLSLLADAAVTGRKPQRRELVALRQLGRQAAEQSVGAERVVDLYLSAAWRLWRTIPARRPPRV